MALENILAGITVADMQAAKAWYSAFFDREPDKFPWTPTWNGISLEDRPLRFSGMRKGQGIQARHSFLRTSTLSWHALRNLVTNRSSGAQESPT